MRRLISLAVLDQALLSALSLGVGLVLIKFGTVTSVGTFALALSMAFLSQGVQNAMVITPAAVRIFGVSRDRQAEVLETLTTMDLCLSAGVSMMVLVAGRLLGFTVIEALGAAFLVSTNLVRELARGILIGIGNIKRCIALDATYVSVAAISVYVLWQWLSPALACMTGLAIGNGVAAFGLAPRFHRRPGQIAEHVSDYKASYWAEVRWMLVGAGAYEIHERSYVFMMQMMRGTAALGMLHAGRFLISPLGLLTTAWGRAMRPQMAAYLRDGDVARARGIVGAGILVMVGLTAIYILCILSLWNYIDRLLFGERYGDMWPVVAAWCGYSLLSVPASCLSFYYQAEKTVHAACHGGASGWLRFIDQYAVSNFACT